LLEKAVIHDREAGQLIRQTLSATEIKSF